MKEFRDRNDRKWHVEITIDAARQVRNLVGIDLIPRTREDAEKMIDTIMSDPYTLVDMVYVLVKEQADEREIDDREFGRAMAGDAIEHAMNAVLEELTDFFQNERTRQMMKRALEHTRKATERFRDRLEANLDQVLEETAEAEIDKAIAAFQTPGSKSTNSPASSGSTPAD